LCCKQLTSTNPQQPGQVKLDGFEGGPDALLLSVREDKLSIYDVPIAQVVEQYAAFLAMLSAPDLDLAGEFILIAATLMELKSHKLLPPRPRPAEEEEEEDPVVARQQMEQRLEEFRRYREVAELLRDLESQRSRYFTRPAPPDLPPPVRALAALPEPAVMSLLGALKRLLEEADQAEPTATITREGVTLRMRMREVWGLLMSAGESGVAFQDLFHHGGSRLEIIATFLAILELLRLGRIRVAQERPLAPIIVYRVSDQQHEPREDPANR